MHNYRASFCFLLFIHIPKSFVRRPKSILVTSFWSEEQRRQQVWLYNIIYPQQFYFITKRRKVQKYNVMESMLHISKSDEGYDVSK